MEARSCTFQEFPKIQGASDIASFKRLLSFGQESRAKKLIANEQRQKQKLGSMESGFDGGVYFGVGEFRSYSDAIHDGFLVRGAVAYDADSADA